MSVNLRTDEEKTTIEILQDYKEKRDKTIATRVELVADIDNYNDKIADTTATYIKEKLIEAEVCASVSITALDVFTRVAIATTIDVPMGRSGRLFLSNYLDGNILTMTPAKLDEDCSLLIEIIKKTDDKLIYIPDKPIVHVSVDTKTKFYK